MNTTSDNLAFTCPYCGRRLEAEADKAGMELDCPGCGQKIAVPGAEATNGGSQEGTAIQPEAPDLAGADKEGTTRDKAMSFLRSQVGKVKSIKAESLTKDAIRDRMTGAIGIEKLQGFSFSELFAQVFAKHSQKEVEESFTIGTEASTPNIEDVDVSWPKPWLFIRMMAASLLFFGLFWAGMNSRTPTFFRV